MIYTETDYYLVTAAHVAKETGLESIIVFSLDNSIPLVKKLRDIVYEKQKLIWTIHPNADVAVIQLDYESVIKNNLCCFFPFENINYQLNAPFREREVTIYGFPKSLGIGKRISPITKTLKPSSGLIDLQRSDTNSISTFYLLDDPGVSGFSGGPVYELSQEIGIGRETKLVLGNRIVGLVSGTIIDKAGGFTSIVPSFYIKEAIENAPGLSDTVIIRYDYGKTWNLRVFKNGEPWTVISNFDINGNPQEKGTLKNGDDSQYIYDKKNKLIKIKYYENGHLVREEIK